MTFEIQNYIQSGKRCHLVGVGRMKSALASGTHAYDGNRTPAKEYMARFAGFDIAQVWGE